MGNSFTTTTVTGAQAMGAYLTVAEARTLGATLTVYAGVTMLLAKSDSDLSMLLLSASIDIDTTFVYQGRKVDLSGDSGGQVRAFPRYTHAPYSTLILRQPSERDGAAGVNVWDWDATLNQAVVPEAVKQACVIQAAYLAGDDSATNQARLEAIRGGLAGQKIGSLSETYIRPDELPGAGGAAGARLCDAARGLMNRYRLTSSELV